VTQERRGHFSAVIDLLDRMSNIVTAVNIYEPVREMQRCTARRVGRAFAAFSRYLSLVIVVVVKSNLASLSREQPLTTIIRGGYVHPAVVR